MESEFPSNSKSRKAPRQGEERKDKLEPVVTGRVIKRKKSWTKRVSETFTGDDTKGVLEYVIIDVFVPAAKDLIADMVSQGVERKLFGDSSPRSRRSRGSSGSPLGHVAYNRYSSSSREPREERRASRRTTRDIPKYDELVLDTRVEAEEVLLSLFNQLEKYEFVTVAALFDLCNLTGDFTDEKYGWVDLDDARIKHVRDGYLLVLPRPEPIN